MNLLPLTQGADEPFSQISLAQYLITSAVLFVFGLLSAEAWSELKE